MKQYLFLAIIILYNAITYPMNTDTNNNNRSSSCDTVKNPPTKETYSPTRRIGQ